MEGPAEIDPKLLGEAMRHLGLRLSVEQDAEMQGLVSAAFVRLSQQAATNRCFPAMEQALDLIAGVESQRPGIAQSLRAKMADGLCFSFASCIIPAYPSCCVANAGLVVGPTTYSGRIGIPRAPRASAYP